MDRKEGARTNLPLPYSFCYDASLVECEKFFFSCMIKALLVVIFDKKNRAHLCLFHLYVMCSLKKKTLTPPKIRRYIPYLNGA